MRSPSFRAFAAVAPPCLAALALALVAAPARAEPIVVLGVEAVGVPDAQAQALTDALRAELKKRPTVQVMPGKDYVEMKLLFGCTDEAQLGACMAQVGKSLVADRLLLGTLRGDTKAAKSQGKVDAQLFPAQWDPKLGIHVT